MYRLLYLPSVWGDNVAKETLQEHKFNVFTNAAVALAPLWWIKGLQDQELAAGYYGPTGVFECSVG